MRELARQHTEDAIRTLAAIMLDGEQPARARVAAAEALLDRGWGRPEQPVTGADGERLVIQVIPQVKSALEQLGG